MKGYDFRDQLCNICGSGEADYLGVRRSRTFAPPVHPETRIYRCRTCDLIYPNPMPVADESSIQENYGSLEAYFPDDLGSPIKQKYHRYILGRLEGTLGRKGRILDCGCGRGELLVTAAKNGWEAVGTEVSRHFAAFARDRFGVKVLLGEVTNLEIPAESYDAVCMVSVLHFTHDPKAQLQAIHRLLQKDGVLFIETMDHRGWQYRCVDWVYALLGERRTMNLSPTFPPYELFGFSSKSIRSLLEATGFSIVDMQVHGGVSETKTSTKRLSDAVQMLAFKTLQLTAKYFGGGQVLWVVARKRSA